jgi:hypothetical protein
VVDKNLRKPPEYTNTFTAQHYLQRGFPVYTADTEAIINATDIAVKKLESNVSCNTIDTITVAHTTFLLETTCEGPRKIKVTLITRIEETQTSYSFKLVRHETDIRKAQRKLLDFAAYINH